MTESRFESELVIVYCREGGGVSHHRAFAMTDPAVESKWGGRFLCGRLYYPDTPRTSAHGRRISVSFNDISSYVEFETVDEYVTASAGGDAEEERASGRTAKGFFARRRDRT